MVCMTCPLSCAVFFPIPYVFIYIIPKIWKKQKKKDNSVISCCSVQLRQKNCLNDNAKGIENRHEICYDIFVLNKIIKERDVLL